MTSNKGTQKQGRRRERCILNGDGKSGIPGYATNRMGNEEWEGDAFPPSPWAHNLSSSHARQRVHSDIA